MYNRLISNELRSCKKSILLLGPRQVGKSTLIESLNPDLRINLANESEYFSFQSNLNELERRIGASAPRTVFIDEIQRIPRLTNTIQDLVDHNKQLKFYLTGSSARKLKRGRANLLPGRLISFSLAPLSFLELGSDFDIEHAMSFGFLPEVQTLQSIKEKKQLLMSYANQYLKEEILAEALVRSVDGFVRFLREAAVDSGKFLDFSKIARKSKIPRQSGVRHFEILVDTMIAHRSENDPDFDSIDLVRHPKFFFFDLGVLNAILGSFQVSKDREGLLFEHFIFNQLFNTGTALNLDFEIYNFRTRGGLEIDFMLKRDNKRFAIECKSSDSVSSSELNSLRSLDQYKIKCEKLVIYRGKRELKDDKIWILPIAKAFEVMGFKK